MATNRASQALLSRIADLVVRELDRDDLFVAQAPAQVGLSDAHLTLLQQLEQDRLTDVASVARLVELSRMVDCIQDRSGNVTLPTHDPRYLSDTFQQVINNVTFHNAALSPADQQRYEQAVAQLYEDYPLLKKAAYDEFCTLRITVEKTDIVLLEIRQNLRQITDADARALLESELAERERLHVEQQQLLAALDQAHRYRAAEAIIAAATRTIDQVPSSVRIMLETIELLTIQDPITHDAHVACSFIPDHLGQDHWAPLRLTKQEIMQTSPATGTTTDAPATLDETMIDSIELEVQTILCERPWFWSALFENSHWGWLTPSDPISTGEAVGGAAELIPAYIDGLIFARNVKIKGQPSAEAHFRTVNLNGGSGTDLLLRTLRPLDLQLGGSLIGDRLKVVPPKILDPGVLQPLKSPVLIRPDVFDLARKRPFGRSEKTTELLGIDNLAVVDPKLINSPWIKQKSLFLQVAFLATTVTGQVVDEAGNGIYQANVTVTLPTGARQLLTDQEGRFTLTLSKGAYPLQLEKVGFVTSQSTLTVPHTTPPPPLVMYPAHVCPLRIQLLARVDGAVRPFTGEAKLVIRGDHYERIEVMQGQTEREFKLPAGHFAVTVVSSDATQIALASQTVTLAPSAGAAPLLTYTILPAPILSNPAVQLIGFICRKVPKCP